MQSHFDLIHCQRLYESDTNRAQQTADSKQYVLVDVDGVNGEDGDAGDDIEGEPVPAHHTGPAPLWDDEAPEPGDDGEVGPHPGLRKAAKESHRQ